MLQESKQIKIAYITTSFASLSHTFIRREIESLTQHGVEIGLFGVRPDPSCKTYGKTIYLYPICISRLIKSFLKLLYLRPVSLITALFSALLNEELNPIQHLKIIYHFIISLPHSVAIIEGGYDHIHAHFINVPTTIAMCCSNVTTVPFSFTCHSAGELGLNEVIGVKQKVKKASFVRVISEFLLKDLESVLKNKKSVHLIRCGLDFSKSSFIENKKPNHPYKIVAVGRLVEKKGFIYLIQAIEILNKRRTDLELSIIGTGELFDDLSNLVKQNKLNEIIFFLGEKSQEEVDAYLESSDLLIVPSVTSSSGEKEGMPTVIVEGIRASIPIIATRHSGIPEVIQDQETGFLVDEANVSNLAEAIDLALNNRELSDQVAKNAFYKVKELYDQEKITVKLLELFKSNAN